AQLIPTHQYGIYHLVNANPCSRWAFANEILRLANLSHIPNTPLLGRHYPPASPPPPLPPPPHTPPPPPHTPPPPPPQTTAATRHITLRPSQQSLAEPTYAPQLTSEQIKSKRYTFLS